MSLPRSRIRNVRDSIENAVRLRALSGAFGLTVVGTLTSFVAFLVFRPLATGLLGPSFPVFTSLLTTKGSQVGFAVFVGGFLALTDGWTDYVRIRRPGVHDLVWVVVGAAGLDLMADATLSVLPLLGLSAEVLSGTGVDSLDVGLATWPVLWPVVFVLLYLLPALVEEQFFRGIVQGKLREGFHPVTEVVLGGGLFSLGHGLYGIGGGPEFLAALLVVLFGQGLVFCLMYERTDNLLVSATAHALSWTDVPFPFFGLL